MTSTAIAISAMNKRKNEEETHILPVGSVKEKDRVAIERMLDSSTLKQGTREHPTNTIFSLNVNEGEEILKPLLCERTPSVSSQKSEVCTSSSTAHYHLLVENFLTEKF